MRYDITRTSWANNCHFNVMANPFNRNIMPRSFSSVVIAENDTVTIDQASYSLIS